MQPTYLAQMHIDGNSTQIQIKIHKFTNMNAHWCTFTTSTDMSLTIWFALSNVLPSGVFAPQRWSSSSTDVTMIKECMKMQMLSAFLLLLLQELWLIHWLPLNKPAPCPRPVYQYSILHPISISHIQLENQIHFYAYFLWDEMRWVFVKVNYKYWDGNAA